MVCPICDVESDNNHSCSNCNWEFIYFSEEPTYQQKIEYNEMMFSYAKNIAEFLIQQNEPYDFFVAKALTFKPDIDLYLALINFYVEKQEFDFALELALESLKLTPCPMAYFGVAACYVTLGQYTTALEYAKKAIEFDPTLPMDYVFGNIYRGLNQQNKAIEYYEKYLLLNPNDADIKKYIKDSKIQVNTSNKIQDDKIQKVNTVQVQEVAKKETLVRNDDYLLKNMFETMEEYKKRVDNFVLIIGTGYLKEYYADKEVFEVQLALKSDLVAKFPHFELLNMRTFYLNIPRNFAKDLYLFKELHEIELFAEISSDNDSLIISIKKMYIEFKGETFMIELPSCLKYTNISYQNGLIILNEIDILFNLKKNLMCYWKGYPEITSISMGYRRALSYVDAVNIGGYNDWAFPTPEWLELFLPKEQGYITSDFWTAPLCDNPYHYYCCCVRHDTKKFNWYL